MFLFTKTKELYLCTFRSYSIQFSPPILRIVLCFCHSALGPSSPFRFATTGHDGVWLQYHIAKTATTHQLSSASFNLANFLYPTSSSSYSPYLVASFNQPQTTSGSLPSPPTSSPLHSYSAKSPGFRRAFKIPLPDIRSPYHAIHVSLIGARTLPWHPKTTHPHFRIPQTTW